MTIKSKIVNNKETIKVTVNPISKRIENVKGRVIKNQISNTPIEFTLNREVDFGEF